MHSEFLYELFAVKLHELFAVKFAIAALRIVSFFMSCTCVVFAPNDL